MGYLAEMPQAFLHAFASADRGSLVAFRAFDGPALVIFPAVDENAIESLIGDLYGSTDELKDELENGVLVTLTYADARFIMDRELPANTAVLAEDLVRHAELSTQGLLLQFPGHGLLVAPAMMPAGSAACRLPSSACLRSRSPSA